MWILQFLPNWIFYVLCLAGIAAILVTHFVKILPHAKLIQIGSIVVVLFSIYMIGAISNNDAWLARAQEISKRTKTSKNTSLLVLALCTRRET